MSRWKVMQKSHNFNLDPMILIENFPHLPGRHPWKGIQLICRGGTPFKLRPPKLLAKTCPLVTPLEALVMLANGASTIPSNIKERGHQEKEKRWRIKMNRRFNEYSYSFVEGN